MSELLRRLSGNTCLWVRSAPVNQISPWIRGSKITDALAAQGGITYGVAIPGR